MNEHAHNQPINCIVFSLSGISCGHPGILRHGSLMSRGFKFQNQVNYTCDQYFEIHGDVNRTCLADGTWSGAIPECIASKLYFCRCCYLFCGLFMFNCQHVARLFSTLQENNNAGKGLWVGSRPTKGRIHGTCF